MKIQLNQGVELDIDDDIIFNNIAKQLGLPSDWRDCRIFEGELVRYVKYGPEEVREVITNVNSLVDNFKSLKLIYKYYKDDHNKTS